MGIRFTLLLCIAVSSLAYPQEKSNQAQETTAAEQRATDKNPISVKIPAAPDAAAEAAKQEQYRDQQARQNARLVNATIALAVVTSILAVFTGGLWWATYSLGRQARRTSERQTGETAKALKISEDAAKAAQAAAAALSNQFSATHRPVIRIKHLYITSDVWGDKPVEIKLVIVNVGITPAIVVKMNLDLVILNAGAKLPPRTTQYPTPDKVLREPQIPSGVTVALPRITRHNLSSEDHARLVDGTKKLWCFGFVEYADTDNRIRTTAFCRIWEPPSGPGALGSPGRFVPVLDPDYEYQD
jgi:hypothetical protein